jgi:hypothetical protein
VNTEGLLHADCSPPSAGAELLKRLRNAVCFERPRRIELDAADSKTFRAEQERSERILCRTLGNFFRNIPVFLYRPETRFVQWDDYELLQVLSATCFTPDPEVTK